MASTDPPPPIDAPHLDNSDASTLRPPPASRSWLTFASNWALELASTLLGVLCVAALAIILAHYDHRPPPLFGSHASTQLTLNTIVAIVTTAAKAFFTLPLIECISQQKWMYFARKQRKLSRFATFEKATKGIVGAFRLLWETAAKNVAAVSPAVMLLGFALEPFSQQLVFTTTVKQLTVADGLSGGTLGAVSYWSGGNGNLPNIAGGNGAITDSVNLVSPGMLDAIWSGLEGTDAAAFNLDFACPGGDCTFQYETLGVCGQVVDVSDQLVPTTISASPGNANNQTSWCASDGTCLDVQGWECDSTTNGCNVLPGYQAGLGSGFIQLVPAISSTNVPLNSTSTTPTLLSYNQSIAFSNISSPILDAFILVQNATGCDGVPGPWCWQDNVWKYTAWEFVLHWCVSNSTTTVVNGAPTTQKSIIPSNFTFSGPGQNLTTTISNSQGSGFSVNYNAHAGLQDYLVELFNGTASETTAAQGQWSVTSDLVQYLTSSWDWNFAWTVTDPEITGFGLLLQNLTLSMTTYMQNTAASTNQIVHGPSYRDIDIITVRWKWITGLAIFAGLVVFMIFATILEQSFGKLRGGEAWKSSPLAMLHALDPALQSRLSGITNLSSMTAQDDKQLVRLCFTPGDGWRLEPDAKS